MHLERAKLLKNFGQWCFGAGALIVAFLAFQLWGTSYVEGAAQEKLAQDFAALSETFEPQLAAEADEPSSEDVADESDSPDPGLKPASSVAPDVPPDQIPAVGEPIGLIRIPAIGLDKVIVQGVGLDELRGGPGHYNGSPLPGQRGNAAIAGHRTTYGAPFGDLDLLNPGDIIEVETFQGLFEYEVLPQPSESGRELGHFIVGPSDTYVIEDYGDNRLTLTACHPKYTANERIIVHAELIADDSRFSGDAPAQPTEDAGDEAAVLPGEDLEPTESMGAAEDIAVGGPAPVTHELDEAFGWNTKEIPAVFLWAIIAGSVVLVARALAKRVKAWPTYLMATPLFLVALWVCFSHLNRLLPQI